MTAHIPENGLQSSTSTNGLGYGLGVRYMMNKSVFLQTSFDADQYNEIQTGAVTQKMKSSSFTLGIGAKF